MCIQRPAPWPDRCEHDVCIPDGMTAAEVCDDCNEELGSIQAEERTGKEGA